ncbi:MAG: glycoside hydrolase family 57 protein [Paludibacteraceae bacterium]|nr:glycoside hydrolase family 57 protein [Paludibacteraceae bacterium]
MKQICLYFEVHIPYTLKRYRFFEIGNDHYYYDDFANEERVRYLAEKSFLPANKILLDLIKKLGNAFSCTFSLSGSAIEQLEQYAPEVIDSFQELAETGRVEFLAEPYGHSMVSLYDENEFERQVQKHSAKIKELFGKKPTSFRNTDFIYSDEIGEKVASMGYKTMLMEGAKHILGWRSPNYVYSHAYLPKLKLLARNFVMSNHVTFEFSNTSWSEFPLTADKYVDWILASPEGENIFNIWMGYDTFGVVQKDYTGIFEFLKALPQIAVNRGVGFVRPSDLAKEEAVAALSAPYPLSWQGEEKDLSIMLGNQLQEEAIAKLYSVTERVNLCKEKNLKRDWLHIQCADYFRYMSFKSNWGSTFESPYDAFINYMNILSDFLLRVDAEYPTSIDNEELNELLKTINDQEKVIEKLEKEVKSLKKKKKEA